jgi:hypothetical protein
VILGTVETYVPRWQEFLVSGLWPLAKILLFLAVSLYPWPKGAPLRLLQVGAGLMAINAVWSYLVFLGAFGAPPVLGETNGGAESGFWDFLGFFVLQFGAMLLSVVGGWRLARSLIGNWGRRGLS